MANDLPPDGFEQGHNPDLPPDGFDDHKSLHGFLTNAWNDVKEAGDGVGAILKAPFQLPYKQIGQAIRSGETIPGSSLDKGLNQIKNMAVEAVPHKNDDGSMSAGSLLQRVGELTPGAGKVLDAAGIKTDDPKIGHPLDALYEHPVNTALDYSMINGAAKSALGAAGKAAEVVGGAGKAAEAVEKVGHVGDEVGLGSQILSATSNMPKAAFQAIKDSPDLIKNGPEVSDAVKMVQDAHNDLTSKIQEPVSQLSKVLSSGVDKVKGQYSSLINDTQKAIMDHLSTVKDAASKDYDEVLGKMGLQDSYADWLKSPTDKAPTLDGLKGEYKQLAGINDAEPTKLKGMYDLRQNLDDMIDYAAQNKTGMTGKDTRRLEEFRADVDNKIGNLPGGDAIHALDDKWSSVMQNRRQLFQKFNNPDTAAKTLDGIATGDRESRVVASGLQDLEKMTGKQIVTPFVTAAKPMADTISDLEPHLKSPEAVTKLITDQARGKAASLQQQALSNLDSFAGTNVSAEASKLKDLADLKHKLGDHFTEPGMAENKLRTIFENPDKNKDMQDALAQLESVTGKPIGQTVNDALAKDYAGQSFNTSKSNLLLRAGVPIIAGGAAAAGHLLPAALMSTAVSPKLIAKGIAAGAKASEFVDHAKEATHLGGLSAATIGKVGLQTGRVAEDEQKQDPNAKGKATLLKALRKG